MPIYEYECLQCEKRTEWLQRMDDAPLAACPQCGGEVRKLISAPAFQFKGKGWYVTDYGGKKEKGASQGKSESKSESKSEGSSDSTSSSSEGKGSSSSESKGSSSSESKGSSGSESKGSSGSSD
jgi:putative FmdB family regulatory protein